jgi:hypothetical protein
MTINVFWTGRSAFVTFQLGVAIFYTIPFVQLDLSCGNNYAGPDTGGIVLRLDTGYVETDVCIFAGATPTAGASGSGLFGLGSVSLEVLDL